MNKRAESSFLVGSLATDPDVGSSATSNVSALERGISVLRCFDENTRSLGNQQLSLLTGIPKPTLTRLTSTLVNLGLLKQDTATESFVLGPGIMPMARAFLANLAFRASARPLSVSGRA
jgi:IclR family transcriptional regulator, positive regulator for flagellar biogenesis